MSGVNAARPPTLHGAVSGRCQDGDLRRKFPAVETVLLTGAFGAASAFTGAAVLYEMKLSTTSHCPDRRVGDVVPPPKWCRSVEQGHKRARPLYTL